MTDDPAGTAAERVRWRLSKFFWRLCWSDYTTWRQDRAFRRWARGVTVTVNGQPVTGKISKTGGSDLLDGPQ